MACLGFHQFSGSFCHTAAYPKPVDINKACLFQYVARYKILKMAHSYWLNRMLLPDTLVISVNGFSFGGGLVAGSNMLLDMPESILVRFTGTMAGVTLRDLVHAIPLYGIKQGLLTVEKRKEKCVQVVF